MYCFVTCPLFRSRFWESHDPTQGNGQGNDRGTQYRSGIYCVTIEQEALAKASKAAYKTVLTKKGKGKGKGNITTEIVMSPPPKVNEREREKARAHEAAWDRSLLP